MRPGSPKSCLAGPCRLLRREPWGLVGRALRMNVLPVIADGGWGQASRACLDEDYGLHRRRTCVRPCPRGSVELLSHHDAFAIGRAVECRVRDVPRAVHAGPCGPGARRSRVCASEAQAEIDTSIAKDCRRQVLNNSKLGSESRCTRSFGCTTNVDTTSVSAEAGGALFFRGDRLDRDFLWSIA